VAESRCFTGFDSCLKVLELPEVNYVILATPPQFRPREFRAAIDAGKHVFMEKPVAVDVPGVNSILETGKVAARKGLAVGAGTQRRHSLDHVETVKRLHDGAIGKIFEARAYFNVGEIWMIPRESGWSDAEWQYRNWPWFTWLSGDCIVEQHIHMLDLVNWILGEHPVRAYGVGGRVSHERGDNYGNIYDHFAIEFEYPSGARLFSQNRQIENCTVRMAVAALGEKGSSNCENRIQSATEWRYEGPMTEPYEQEHMDLIASIRGGQPVNEAEAVAESTLTGILGREAAYTGKVLDWNTLLESKRSYTPERYQFGPMAFPEVVNPKTYKFV
jgi:predicted dehydrogenase